MRIPKQTECNGLNDAEDRVEAQTAFLGSQPFEEFLANRENPNIPCRFWSTGPSTTIGMFDLATASQTESLAR